MRFENLKVKMRNMTDEEMEVWNASKSKEDEYNEIEIFKERFEDVLDKYQGEFEENLQKWLEEYSNLEEVFTMSRVDAERICKEIYTKGWRDFKITNDEDTVSLEMSLNIYGNEFDCANPFDLVFYDKQGFEHDRVPVSAYDSEEYDNLVRETLDNLDDIIQYVYDVRDSYESHIIELGDYKLIVSPDYDY